MTIIRCKPYEYQNGTKLMSVELGLRRTFSWPFIVTKVTLLEANFLYPNDILVHFKQYNWLI